MICSELNIDHKRLCRKIARKALSEGRASAIGGETALILEAVDAGRASLLCSAPGYWDASDAAAAAVREGRACSIWGRPDAPAPGLVEIEPTATQREVRAAVRGLLMLASLDQLRAEREASRAAGDGYRAECIGELIDAYREPTREAW